MAYYYTFVSITELVSVPGILLVPENPVSGGVDKLIRLDALYILLE